MVREHSGSHLQKTSSLVLDGPARSATAREQVKVVTIDDERSEIVPDSEEERVRRAVVHRLKLPQPKDIQVIEITSEEEDIELVSKLVQRGSQPEATTAIREISPQTAARSNESSEEELPVHVSSPKKKFTQTPRTRRIVYSSDSDNSDHEVKTPPAKKPVQPTGVVIDLTVTDSEESDEGSKPVPRQREGNKFPKKPSLSRARPKLSAAGRSDDIPLFVDEDEDDDEDVAPPAPVDDDKEDIAVSPDGEGDDAILVLDEPRSARKPIRKPALSVSGAGPSTPRRPAARIRQILDSDSEDDTPLSTPSSRAPTSAPTSAARSKGAKAPRMTKKVLAAAEQTRREAVARNFFVELNRRVFKGGIPPETELKWSKRLLTTAGKARWHKSRDGAQTSEIELAVKILDSDERIKNTLSHEMCHLACWIINGDPKEGHGQIFKSWATRVMRAFPDITVTTKHTYEITYKFEWRCQNCDKIYGRHSKSINPDECVCGACRVGRLIPLFVTRAPKTPKTKADSQLASAMGRDSPCIITPTMAIDLTVGIAEQESPARGLTHGKTVMPGAYEPDEESDVGEVELLSQVLEEMKLAGCNA